MAEPWALHWRVTGRGILALMASWEYWYHCTAHTYGTWLRGDPRGWRARDHREHVDGDYKHPPPPGKYTELFELSKSRMNRDPVKIRRDLHQFVLDQVIQRLLERDNETAIGCFDGIHLHVLTRCWKRNPRVELGSAKQFATARLKVHGFAMGLRLGEGIWGKGSHPEAITGRAHFKKASDYIAKHAFRGAVIWKPRAIPELPELNLLLDDA